jgi:hypothetical protein
MNPRNNETLMNASDLSYELPKTIQ